MMSTVPCFALPADAEEVFDFLPCMEDLKNKGKKIPPNLCYYAKVEAT
jgi:hypothetical protein